MMDFKSVETFAIATDLTASTKVIYGELSNALSSLFDRTLYRFGTLGIGSFLNHIFRV